MSDEHDTQPRPPGTIRRLARGVGALLVLGLLVVVLLDGARVLVALAGDDGCSAVPGDALAWQTLGLGLVAAAWLPARLARRPLGAVGTAVLWSGAALCLAAWPDLRLRAGWAWWCLVPVPLALLTLPARRRPGLGGLVSAGLGLGWVAAAGVGLMDHGSRWYPIPSSPPAEPTTREEAWITSLERLRSELPRLHADAFHSTTPEAFHGELDRLVAAVPDTDDLTLSLDLCALVASVGDAHTALVPSFLGAMDRLPLWVHWFADGLAITHAPSDRPELLGARLLAIADVPIDELLQRVAPLIAHETRGWLLSKSPDWLLRPRVLAWAGVALPAEPGAPLALTVDGADGPRRVLLAARAPEDQPDLATPERPELQRDCFPEHAFWSERLPERDALYLRYRRCRDLLGFRRFAADLLDQLERDPPGRLVLDLRGNTGGSSVQWDWFLLPRLVDGPFDDPERLALLVDRRTYSSGAGNAFSTAERTRARTLGEPTGGALNSYGEVRLLELPGTRLVVSFSTAFHRRVPDAPPDQPALTPEVPAAPSLSDWLAGRDPVLEAALR